MEERDRLRDEVAIVAALTLDALADRAGVDSLQAFSAASHLAEIAERSLHLFVAEAREDGETWAAIGEALGISRQAAYKRFTGKVPEKVTRERAEAPPEQVALALELLEDAAAGRFERIENLASRHLQRLAGSEGLARAFEPVESMYGTVVSRGEPHLQVIGRVLILWTVEQRTRQDVRAEVALGPDSRLLGLNYYAPDAN